MLEITRPIDSFFFGQVLTDIFYSTLHILRVVSKSQWNVCLSYFKYLSTFAESARALEMRKEKKLILHMGIFLIKRDLKSLSNRIPI